MLTWIVQQIIISLVVIILIHSIYKFLQVNLTTPKVRDLVNKPTKQYEEIYNTFKESKKEDEQKNNNSMKSELQNYLKELSVETTTVSKINNEKTPQSLGNMQSMGELQSGTFSDNFSPAYQTL